jgi:hypothetical protein
VVIDFKKKIVYDHTKDSSDHEVTNATAEEEGNNGEAAEEAVVPVEVVKTEQELEAEADRAAIASVLLASAAVKKKRKKHKFALLPLPLVPCVQFRGSSGRSKQSMGMMQSFATLFKMVAQSFGNRDVVSFDIQYLILLAYNAFYDNSLMNKIYPLCTQRLLRWVWRRRYQ